MPSYEVPNLNQKTNTAQHRTDIHRRPAAQPLGQRRQALQQHTKAFQSYVVYAPDISSPEMAMKGS
jgi:hypothetical protein